MIAVLLTEKSIRPQIQYKREMNPLKLPALHWPKANEKISSCTLLWFNKNSSMEMWPRGRRHSPAKGAYGPKLVSRVRIPSSPPEFILVVRESNEPVISHGCDGFFVFLFTKTANFPQSIPFSTRCVNSSSLFQTHSFSLEKKQFNRSESVWTTELIHLHSTP